uniref:Protein phosphatase 1 regulatory subunit 21 N-terminal domain-containing protein n=2 Tax=Clastoptera arizonana TaxID=38151 RepID=A0A1B6DNK4_9HEMI
MDSPGDELQTKYHKIAAEYSKVRAQLAVLKKAIIEEQSRNVELKELLREKDQSLRRADLEADSLTFRNEQLTRRVTVLQEELDGLQNQTKAKKNKMKIEEGHQNSEITNHIIDEEFRKKIAENAQLLSLMHEKEESFKNENSYLTSQIEKLEQELNQLRITSLENAESYKNIISELKSEISCIKNDQKQNGQMSVELSLLQKSHSEYELAAETKLNSLNKIIKEQLSFIDSSNEVFNSLNVNCTADLKQGNVSNNSLDDLRSALEQLCTTLANWHSYTALRLCLLPTNKSTVNFKYSKHLNEMNELATELSSSIRFDLVELENDSKISAIQDFSGKLLKYSNLSETLLIHQRLSIEEENGKFNKEISKENNEKLLDNSNQLIKIILQLNSHIAIATKSNIFLQVMKNFQRKKHDFIRIFETLQEAFEDLFSTYATKSTIESDFADQELKQINEDIANCFSMLMISSAKVSIFKYLIYFIFIYRPLQLMSFFQIVCCLQELTKHADNLQVPHTVVLDLKRRATHYINSLQSVSKFIKHTF